MFTLQLHCCFLPLTLSVAFTERRRTGVLRNMLILMPDLATNSHEYALLQVRASLETTTDRQLEVTAAKVSSCASLPANSSYSYQTFRTLCQTLQVVCISCKAFLQVQWILEIHSSLPAAPLWHMPHLLRRPQLRL